MSVGSNEQDWWRWSSFCAYWMLLEADFCCNEDCFGVSARRPKFAPFRGAQPPDLGTFAATVVKSSHWESTVRPQSRLSAGFDADEAQHSGRRCGLVGCQALVSKLPVLSSLPPLGRLCGIFAVAYRYSRVVMGTNGLLWRLISFGANWMLVGADCYCNVGCFRVSARMPQFRPF
jgi:hypothetical protein